ncbi:MAG TPA: type II toxin-antitoxin system RelE/ParE family toxin [Candidatus Competibacteraceae bacterium]|nr:type II toxin-antitoxin system RelE/ParE family toxin [Candidatus Competibacteraceae bacterium]HRZ05352.1 type II toxin-antitoxin system RelE/ParE family toxin [Candidatus Competibacteraceae bacterium]HSA45156.1 type II toxin-antitoxin system RelE/ParE family toxin [Candidatus Competibacteraceae bacterium]
MLRLNLTHDALSFLDTLSGKQYKQVVGSMFNLLKNPEPHDSSALRGYPYRRVDVGEYRIVYQAQEDELQVMVIGRRNDDAVYRKLARKEQAP